MSDIDAFKKTDAEHHGDPHQAIAPDADSDESEISVSESTHEEVEHIHHQEDN